MNVPTYELTLPPRDSGQYWSFKTTDGSRHGASWQNINWLRRPIDEKMFQVHFSDRIKLPEASVNFAHLIHYLGDLGLQTNPEGFWDLARKGLNVLPGTCLVREIGEDGVEKPIVIVAKQTIEHPGTLLLRFQNKPSKTLKTYKHLSPNWMRVPAYPALTEPAESRNLSKVEEMQSSEVHEGSEAIEGTGDERDERDVEDEGGEEELEQEIVEFVHISRKGIVEKMLTTGKKFPVVGLPFWFVYSMLASTAHGGHNEYNGRPFGFRIRLNILYFSREAVLYFRDNESWRLFYFKLLNVSKMDAIPEEWTEDSSTRRNVHLTKRFELLVDTKLRNRAAELRRSRQQAFRRLYSPDPFRILGDIQIPLEVYEVTTVVWSETARKCRRNIFPLKSDQVPTSQEICIAATSNLDLATMVEFQLKEFLRLFEREGDFPTNYPMGSGAYGKVIYMCAIIILQSIAGKPYSYINLLFLYWESREPRS